MKAGLPALPPARLTPSFYREAGRACAHYVQNGGRIRDIRMDQAQLLRSPLQLTPPPHGNRSLFPVRRELEEDLEMLQAIWGDGLSISPGYSLRFLFSFCQEMERYSSGWRDWAKVWLQRIEAAHQLSVHEHYQHLLTHPSDRSQSHAACWEPNPEIEPAGLKEMLEERMRSRIPSLSNSGRALVIESELLGQPVIIKRYSPNPAGWKQRWEFSRARRAWAASKTLEDLGLPGIQGLGWLEHYHAGKLQESYFISRQLTEMETLRTWLRREFPKLSDTARSRFRHRLRNEILRLRHHGLMHVDLKLSNLLVKGREVEDLVFYWIDLEDLRTGAYSRRTFVRNLFQMNGSLPRSIPEAERRAFVCGFRKYFPFATSPRLHRYIQRRTRKRHLDELKRVQGA